MSLTELMMRERERRIKRADRDRKARSFLALHSEIKDDPDAMLVGEWPADVSEAAVRTLARHYFRKRVIRDLVSRGVVEIDG